MKSLKTILCFLLSAVLLLNGTVTSVQAEETPDPTPEPTASASSTPEASAETPASTPETVLPPAASPAAKPSASTEPEKTSEPEASAVPDTVYPQAASADAGTLAALGYALEEEKSTEFGYTVYSDGTDLYFYGLRSAEDTEPAWYVYQNSVWVSIDSQNHAAAQADGDVTENGFTVSAAGVLTSYVYPGSGTEPSELTVPAAVKGVTITEIGSNAFTSSAATTVNLPSTVVRIDDYAFSKYYDYLTSVTLPDSVTSIGKHAFEGNSLTGVHLPAELKYLGDYAFSGNKLTSIVVPASVGTVSAYAFANNVLTSVTISEGITAIGEGAFKENATLTSILFPSSLQKIDKWAFVETGLTAVALPAKLSYLGGGVFYSTKISNLLIPKSVTTLGLVENISPVEYLLPTEGIYEVYASSAAYKYCVKYGLPYHLAGQSEIHRPDIKGLNFENTDFTIFTDAHLTANVFVDQDYTPFGRNPIVYSSSDESVCKVAAAENTDESVTVTPVSAGTCKITATVKNNYLNTKTYTSTATITIIKPVTAMTVQDIPEIKEGDQVQLQVAFEPAEGIDKHVSWDVGSSSTGDGYVDSDNILHVYKAGSLILTASPALKHGSDTVSATKTVTIEPRVMKLAFNDDPGMYADVLLSKGTMNLSVTATTWSSSTTEGNSHVVWKSSDETVASVSGSGTVNGVITLKAAGSTIITAEADGVVLNYVLNVYSVAPDAQIAFAAGSDYSAAGIKPGTVFPVTLQADGTDISPELVEFTSSNESVASVADGKVTVSKEGTAVITGTIKNDPKGRTATLAVKGTNLITAVRITAPSDLSSAYQITGGSKDNLTGLEIPYSSLAAAGNTIALGYTLWNGNSEALTKTKVTWKSTDASVASVDAKGLVIIKKYGEVTITATAADSNKASSAMSLKIISTQPVLTTTAYTLNKKYLKGEPVDIYDAYGNTIDTVSVLEGTETSKNFMVTGDAASGFRLNYTDAGRSNENLKKNSVSTVRLVLKSSATGNSYFCDVKVKIADADPVIKVSSYSGMVNPFFKANTMKLNLNIAAEDVESIRLVNPDNDAMFTKGFTGITADGTVTVVSPFPADAKGQYHAKGFVLVKMKDYADPVKVAVTIPLKYIKPHFICLPINSTGSGRSSTSVSDKIYGSTGTESTFYGVIFANSGTSYGRTAPVTDYSSISGISAKTTSGTGVFAVTAVSAFNPSIAAYKITSSASGSADITVTSDNWTGSVTFRYTVKYLSSAPAISLYSYDTGKAVTSFTLNKQLLHYDSDSVSASGYFTAPRGTAMTNGYWVGSCYSSDKYGCGVNFKQTSGDKTEGAKIYLSYYYSGSANSHPSLNVYLNYGDQDIKNGSYGYSYDLKDASGNLLKTVKFTVRIVSTKVVLNAKITGSVNPIDRTFDADDAWYSKNKYAQPTENTAGYSISGIAANQQFDYIYTKMVGSTSYYYNVIFPAANAPLQDGKSYPVTLIYSRNGGFRQDLIEVNSTVRVKQVLPQMTVKDVNMTMYNRFSTNKKIGTASFQLNQTNGKAVAVSSRVNAAVSYLEITDAALAAAYRIEWSKTADDNYAVSVYVKDSSLIKAGSVATLPIRIHYKNEAVNTKTFSQLKIKITDKSSLIRPAAEAE